MNEVGIRLIGSGSFQATVGNGNFGIATKLTGRKYVGIALEVTGVGIQRILIGCVGQATQYRYLQFGGGKL